MYDIKKIYLAKWKNRSFINTNEEPVGCFLLPSSNDGVEYDGIWDKATFGEYNNFETAFNSLEEFHGGLIKESTPYRIKLNEFIKDVHKEEYEIFNGLKIAINNIDSSLDKENLENLKFYIIETEGSTNNVYPKVVYHIVRFFPKYNILINKNIIFWKKISDVSKVNNNSYFAFESMILIEPKIINSIIFNSDSSMEILVYDPAKYENYFSLRDVYFSYAKDKFKEFEECKRTISKDDTIVKLEDFNADSFFDEKNILIAKKFARDTLDDKDYPLENIINANEKLKSSKEYKNHFNPLEIDKSKNEIIVTSKSVGTLAAIIDGQIWTNETHKETQTNL